MSTFGSNVTMKVNRAISGATTVGAGCYAVVTYRVTAFQAISIGSVAAGLQSFITNYYGPGQTIPANYNGQISVKYDAGTLTADYTLVSGVEFINTP